MAVDLSKIQSSAGKEKKQMDKDASAFDFLNKDISFFGSGFGDKQKERFYSGLFVLISAGVDIKSVLELMQEQQSKKREIELLGRIRERVINGAGLSEALEKEKGLFSDYEVFSLRIGEESGRMADVLKDQSDYFSRKIKQKRQLMQAITYPTLVISVALGTVYFMLRFIVPMLQDMFKRFGGELPTMTKMVIRASDFVVNYGLFIMLAIGTIAVTVYTQRNNPVFRKIASTLMLRIPFLGPIFHKIYLARFCQSMNLLLGARTPLVHSLELVRNMVGLYPIEESLSEVARKVERGESLHQSLAGYKVYPKQLLTLVRIAEEVNKLDSMFGRLARQYGDEVEHEMGLLSSILEPLIMVCLGLFVILILVAMYLPMFQMGMAVH